MSGPSSWSSSPCSTAAALTHGTCCRRSWPRLLPVAAALDDRLRATTGFEHTLVLWRHEAMTATVRFLEALTAQSEVRTR